MIGQGTAQDIFVKEVGRIYWHFNYSIARAARAFALLPDEVKDAARDYVLLNAPPWGGERWAKHEKEALKNLAQNPPREAAANEPPPHTVTVQKNTTLPRCPVCGC